ncbi:MAG: phosphomannomutase/phosphoglucomutase [Alphaproteobacteria bacterium]|nr:phosphomannomutase/phosphoglucomutase [Alphaproteobacteria bacterium]
MFPVPRADLRPNTAEFETVPLISPNGFREYDARWLYPKEINLIGVQALGLGLATLIHEMGVKPRIVVGHDYRSYSLSVKQALALGLVSGGAEVLDIGLALSPTAYFAQFALDAPCVAMVTASHNENGWTGVKMGAARPLTFGPDEMTALKNITLEGRARGRSGGSYLAVEGVREKYLDDLTSKTKLTRRIKVVAACGNGTAGAYAPEALRRMGAEVIPLDAELDYTFPRYNPNPEDLKMLHALADAVKQHKAEVGLAFDGDGDRCGVVDDQGREIFADKVGVLIARDISSRQKDTQFVVDVKSTGLFMTDPVLIANGAKTEYWKTGHSYIKRRAHELKAQAGFEKSGHYFFNPPIGRGYDDGIVSAAAVLGVLDRAKGQTMSALYDGLPKTYGSPTMAPHCADEKKYGVVDEMIAAYTQAKARGEKIMGLAIRDLVTVNGVRVTLEDGTWGLVRASSNKPSLVVVVESPVSEERMRGIFADIDGRLSKNANVGAYDQKI